MKRPADVRLLLQRRFDTQHRNWLVAAGDDWPLEIALGVPAEVEAMRQPDAVRAWASEWRAWHGAGKLEWVDRQWRSLGAQRLPRRLKLASPTEVAAWAGQRARWDLAVQRAATLAARWPQLGPHLGKLFEVLADYANDDLERLADTLGWLDEHPNSGYYVRQLPVAGLDTKWIEARRSVLADLLAALHGSTEPRDFYERCGLKRPPRQLRVRMLDATLRTAAGGLGDITAPVSELAGLDIAPRTVLIVENLQTGLALQDLPGALAIMGLGYSVDMAAELSWLRDAACLYWGDLDTHGFAILSKARRAIPGIKSLLMDEGTLLGHRLLWSTEASQHGAPSLEGLTPAESDLYQALKSNRFGDKVRLEQERIDWALAWQAIRQAASA